MLRSSLSSRCCAVLMRSPTRYELMYVDFGALIGEQAGLTPSINNIDLDAILQAAMTHMQQ